MSSPEISVTPETLLTATADWHQNVYDLADAGLRTPNSHANTFLTRRLALGDDAQVDVTNVNYRGLALPTTALKAGDTVSLQYGDETRSLEPRPAAEGTKPEYTLASPTEGVPQEALRELMRRAGVANLAELDEFLTKTEPVRTEIYRTMGYKAVLPDRGVLTSILATVTHTTENNAATTTHRIQVSQRQSFLFEATIDPDATPTPQLTSWQYETQNPAYKLSSPELITPGQLRRTASAVKALLQKVSQADQT